MLAPSLTPGEGTTADGLSLPAAKQWLASAAGTLHSIRNAELVLNK
jgi:hypothetical protein